MQLEIALGWLTKTHRAEGNVALEIADALLLAPVRHRQSLGRERWNLGVVGVCSLSSLCDSGTRRQVRKLMRRFL